MLDGNTAQDLTKTDVCQLSGGRRYVYQLMRTGGWWTYRELQDEIQRRYGVFFSEACISARIRDLRKWEYGQHTVTKRARHGRTFEFHLEAK